MQITHLSSPKFSVNYGQGDLPGSGQVRLERDWRFQEIQSAIYNHRLTQALSEVWESWLSELNKKSFQPAPEFSTLRKLPIYNQESDDEANNIQLALRKGGSIIMACPLLSPFCGRQYLGIKIKWLADKLVFNLKNTKPSFQTEAQLKFDELSALIDAMRKMIDEGGVFNQTPPVAINQETLAI